MSIVLYAGHHDCYERWLRLQYTPTLVISSFPFTLLRLLISPALWSRCRLLLTALLLRFPRYLLFPMCFTIILLWLMALRILFCDPGLVFSPCTPAIPSSVLFHVLLRFPPLYRFASRLPTCSLFIRDTFWKYTCRRFSGPLVAECVCDIDLRISMEDTEFIFPGRSSAKNLISL